MKNKAVVLVYPSSRTRNLIKNIRELNYTPIVISATAHDKLTLQTRGTTVINQWASAVKSKEYAKYKPDILEFDKNMDYQKLTNYIKNKYDVLAVIPCSDLSIKLGDFLQKEFKLTSNPKEWVENEYDKAWVNKKIEAANIRAIKTKTINHSSDLNIVAKYFNNSFPLFIKPVSGGGSINAYKITSADDLKEKVKMIYSSGRTTDELILQEFIAGDLYIINFFTFDGVPSFVDMWSYKRTISESGCIIIKNTQFINKITPEYATAIEYTAKTISACGHKNGFVHSEIMIDSKGPVLVEHNWRMMGAVSFLDTKLINNKYSDNSFMLNAYLNPSKAKNDISIVNPSKLNHIFVVINNYGKTSVMKENYIQIVLRNLHSYISAHLYVTNGQTAFFTNNVDDCLAMVDLQHKNYKIVTNDQSLIFEINEKTPEVFYLLDKCEPIFLNANAKKDLTIAKQIKKSIPKCKKVIDDKIPTDIIEAFKYVESLYKSLKKGDVVAITNYAIDTNIRGLKALFCLNNFSYLLCNDFLTKAMLFVKK